MVAIEIQEISSPGWLRLFLYRREMGVVNTGAPVAYGISDNPTCHARLLQPLMGSETDEPVAGNCI